MNKIDISILLLLLFIIITLIFIKFNNNKKEHMDNQIKNILKLNNIKENFIVSDAQDIQNYQKLKDKVLEEPDNYNQEKIANPEEKDKVNIENKKEDEYSFVARKGMQSRWLIPHLLKTMFLKRWEGSLQNNRNWQVFR